MADPPSLHHPVVPVSKCSFTTLIILADIGRTLFQNEFGVYCYPVTTEQTQGHMMIFQQRDTVHQGSAARFNQFVFQHHSMGANIVSQAQWRCRFVCSY